MTADEARTMGVPPEHVESMMKMTVQEAKTDRCETCNGVLKVFPDARWRFSTLQPCRCDDCARMIARETGASFVEAKWVV